MDGGDAKVRFAGRRLVWTGHLHRNHRDQRMSLIDVPSGKIVLVSVTPPPATDDTTEASLDDKRSWTPPVPTRTPASCSVEAPDRRTSSAGKAES
jgi:hypothetical protein